MRFALTSDTHIKESRPPCRSDNFLETQEAKWKMFLKADADAWLVGGDLFDTNPPTEFMKKWFLRILNEVERETPWIDGWYKKLFVVYGQHDMEHHSLTSLDRTGIAVLEEAGYLTTLCDTPIIFDNVYIYGANFGEEPPKPIENNKINILVWHKMVIDNKLFPGQVADNAQIILDMNTEYDLILTGDNHQTIVKHSGTKPNYRYLVNPGSMVRLKADQAEHKPLFFIYDTEIGELENRYFPIDTEVISREHIKIEEDSKHLEEMIQKMKGTGVKLNFKENLVKYLETNKTHYAVKNIIWKSLEG